MTAEEKSRLQGKIQALETQVSDLEGRLAETQKIAGEFEEKYEVLGSCGVTRLI